MSKARWQTKNLGDVCNVVGGGTPSKDKAAFYSGDIPWATVRDLKQEVITSTEFKITKEAVKSSSTNIIPSGNVVIATRVGLGKVCKKLKIPRPGLGYWAKKAAGKPIPKRPPLPDLLT